MHHQGFRLNVLGWIQSGGLSGAYAAWDSAQPVHVVRSDKGECRHCARTLALPGSWKTTFFVLPLKVTCSRGKRAAAPWHHQWHEKRWGGSRLRLARPRIACVAGAHGWEEGGGLERLRPAGFDDEDLRAAAAHLADGHSLCHVLGVDRALGVIASRELRGQ